MSHVILPRTPLDYFQSDLSKDQHRPGYATADGFVKTCSNSTAAAREFEVLCALDAVPGQSLVPAPVSYDGTTITMELVDGIRVYDVLRLLNDWSVSDPAGPAHQTALALMNRLSQRLTTIQTALSNLANPLDSYSFDVKVTQLLRFLEQVLGIQAPSAEAIHEQQRLSALWSKSVTIPFRDATTKNMIIVDPRLSVRVDDDRQTTLRQIVSAEPEWATSCRIADVDFSSTTALTTPEDDWISLHLHQIPAAYSNGMFDVNTWPTPANLALSLLVRFLRFGGRKMAYQLIYPSAARIRFEFDDASYYFRTLPKLIDTADPKFAEQYPHTMNRIAQLCVRYDAAASIKRSDLVEHRWPLWQESPLAPASEPRHREVVSS